MKCTRCGAEVEAQRFCIYCGESLQGLRVQRAPSGVMRIRHRASISQTSLPEVQKRPECLKETSLSSLKQGAPSANAIDIVAHISSQNVKRIARDEAPMEKTKSPSRQSLELEALLQKLNSASTDEAPAVAQRTNGAAPRDRESFDTLESLDAIPGLKEPTPSFGDITPSLDEPMYSDSAFNSFFQIDNEEETDDDPRTISSSIPVGSGSFSRIPSGGFYLVIDSIKAACASLKERIHGLRNKNTEMAPKRAQTCQATAPTERAQRYAKYAVAAATAVASIAIVATLASKDHDSAQDAVQIAAQAPVAGNETFAILPLDEPEEEWVEDFSNIAFDDDDFSIPALENGKTADETQRDLAVAQNANIERDPIVLEPIELEPIPGDIALPTPADKKKTQPREIRAYNHKDNVLSAANKPETFTTRTTCVMREGPASRFPLVKHIGSKAKIQILQAVEEDWLYNNGVWTKDGFPAKLGPGSLFENAMPGMKVPAPSSRVISAKNWKYVQSGDDYGYVGPACFK